MILGCFDTNNIILIPHYHQCIIFVSKFLVFRWYRKVDVGTLQEIRQGSVLVRPLDSVLQFPRVQTEDAGQYVCVTNNGFGEDRRELLLKVATPLLVHIRPQHQVNYVNIYT